MLRHLGEGTFSEVLKAESVKTRQKVAIKCMKSHFDRIEQVLFQSTKLTIADIWSSLIALPSSSNYPLCLFLFRWRLGSELARDQSLVAPFPTSAHNPAD